MRRQLGDRAGDLAGPAFASWEAALKWFAAQAESVPLLVVLDEVPYLLESSPGFASVVQVVWDHLPKRTRLMLVLTGSAVSVIERLLGGETPIVYGDGDQTRDFLFIDDAVHAFALAADRGSGKLLNVGTGLETTVNGLLAMLCDLTKVEVTPFYEPARDGELRRNALDATAAKEALGWHPWTHLEDGLAETVSFIREG